MRFFKIGKKLFDLDERTIIMGILNVTPDSFSNGGKYFSTELAINHAISMEKDGADIIDIGGESSRPGAASVSLEEEKNRIIPVVEQLIDKLHIPISIDTYKSEIAKKALDLGVSMINDISALHGDKKLANVVEKFDVPICLMHMKGNPRDMQVDPVYDDVVKEIYNFLKERTEYAFFDGIKKEKIIIDPGIGFGKRTGRGIEDNCEIIKRLSEFENLGYPIMVGTSRKTFIGNICGDKNPLPATDRLEGSLAAVCLAVANGADMVRVHDIKETRRCLCLVDRVVRGH